LPESIAFVASVLVVLSFAAAPLFGGPARTIRLRVLTLNVHGGAESDATRIGEFLAKTGADIVSLQEVPDLEYRDRVAEVGGYEHATGIDRFKTILSRVPIDKEEVIRLVDSRSLIRVALRVEGIPLSIYGVHNSWDAAGDRQARHIVDEVIPADENPRKLFLGDFNDEHYSTQSTILESELCDAWTDLGVRPSSRVTWPSTGFGGSEGAQLIDLLLYAPESGIVPVAGEILDEVRVLSDHRAAVFDLEISDPIVVEPPQSFVVDTNLGDSMIELRFDRELDVESAQNVERYTVERIDSAGEPIRVSIEGAIVDRFRRRVRLSTGVHEDGARYRVIVTGVASRGGVEATEQLAREYRYVRNLLRDPGAEGDLDDWAITGGGKAYAELRQLTPYVGDAFFAGGERDEDTRFVQEIDLSPFDEEIDSGRGRLRLAAHLATGYTTFANGEGQLEPYDPAEMIIEVFDESGERVVAETSSGKFDTLYWYPYRDAIDLPRGSRRARISLRGKRVNVVGGIQNDAAFDAVFAGFEQLDFAHGIVGPNLIVNPGAESEDLSGWTGAARRALDGALVTRSKVIARSGDAIFFVFQSGARDGVWLTQSVDLSARDEDEADHLRWRVAIRAFGRRDLSAGRFRIFDANGELLEEMLSDEWGFAEWREVGGVLRIPDGAVRAEIAVGGRFANGTFADDFVLQVVGGPAGERWFERGDVDRDGRYSVSDAVAVLLRRFGPGDFVIPCDDAADVDDDGSIAVADAIGLLHHVFRRGPAPPAPRLGQPGRDPTEDALGCEN